MGPALNFLAPSLHPNTLLDITIPLPGVPVEPIVRSIPINYGSSSSIGNIKQICTNSSGHVYVADDNYRVSTLSLTSPGASEEQEGVNREAKVVEQYQAKTRSGDTWTGLVAVKSGVISSLRSGLLTLHRHPTSSEGDERDGEAEAGPSTKRIDGPVLALASPSPESTTFALAGKEVDVSIRDVERTFSHSNTTEGEEGGEGSRAKRKKTELEAGEIWRAKNMPNNSLRLRPPIYHTCLAYLPDTNASTSVTASNQNGDGNTAQYGTGSSSGVHLVSGTKSGTVRRYDTRQRKPVAEFKIAREGGIGCIAPINENELFFSDRGNFMGCMDLRTGKLLYSYPSLTSSANHLLAIPPSLSSSKNTSDSEKKDSEGWVASISPDATFRLHSTHPPLLSEKKGNYTGGKAKVERMVGGVGVGSFVFMGRTEVEMPKALNGAGEGDEEDGSEVDDGVWDDMGDIEDGSESEGSEEE